MLATFGSKIWLWLFAITWTFSPETTQDVKCDNKLGMKSKIILDESITSSSRLSTNHLPAFARLDGNKAWCSSPRDDSPYIQIHLKEEKSITAITTQGSYLDASWATRYEVRYMDEGNWTTYWQELEGNRNSRARRKNVLQPPIRTRSIRIYPKEPFAVFRDPTFSCLRLELYGCSAPTQIIDAPSTDASETGAPSTAAQSTDAPSTKPLSTPGKCPFVKTPAECPPEWENFCKNDADCPSGLKCCWAGCEFDCLGAFQAVFTSLGASGRLGPTSLGRYYSGQHHERQVTLVNGIQQWSVPYTANYRIEAVGAAGGYGLSSMNGTYRGRGAKMVGTFHLFKSEIIKILVGQEGGINLNDLASGGGGGTFVVRANNTPLIIAGGGGGGEKVTSRHSGCDASTGTAGRAGHMSWSGGSGGHGAQIADNSNSGGGGGGFYSSGRSSKKFGGSMGYGGEGGKGFLQGGVGGRALANNAVGGFGGGGGAYGTGGGGGAGGGGGYSGGSSGENKWGACGGGGGSYNVGQNQQNECCYRTSGHGQVNITMV